MEYAKIQKPKFSQTICLLIGLITLLSTTAAAQTFTLKNTVSIDFGNVWCIPVYDGNTIVVSSEGSGSIKVGKFDLSLNLVSSGFTVASSSDTTNNDPIADHKHIFQNNYHYITFSTSQANYLYLLKLDSDLNRIGITTVVDNDSPTNDMLLLGDGTYIYVGKFYPGTGHKIYQYDSDLNYQNTFVIGGGINTHANGAAAIYTNNQFHLVAPLSLAPGQNDDFYRIIFDETWNVVQNKKSILSDKSMLGIVSALSREPISQDFIIHYGRGSSDAGGPLYRAVYDSRWNLLSNTSVIDGTWTRPHSVIADNTLYVGYDGSDSVVQLSSFDIVPAAATTPTPPFSPTPIVNTTPAATPTETLVATPTPTVTPECGVNTVTVSPKTLLLGKNESGEVVTKVTGKNDCIVEGETVVATIKGSGTKRISLSPASRETDENGLAAFTITTGNKGGKARVIFQAGDQKKLLTVKIKNKRYHREKPE